MLALLAITVTVGAAAVTDGATRSTRQRGFPFGIVSVAQGAYAASFVPEVVRFELDPQPEAPADPLLERRGPAEIPEAAPLPTPVAPPAPPAPRKAYVKPEQIVGTGQLAWPLAGGKITTYYSSYHKALDIAAPAGSPVMASAAGVVTWAGWKNNRGGRLHRRLHRAACSLRGDRRRGHR